MTGTFFLKKYGKKKVKDDINFANEYIYFKNVFIHVADVHQI